MVNLEEVLTFAEAAEKWGLADGNTIRKAVTRKRFEAHEIRKSGNVWLTTYDAMRRVFGEPTPECVYISVFELAELMNIEVSKQEIKDKLMGFYKKAEHEIDCGKQVSVIESKEHPERILYIIKNKKEFLDWQKRMNLYFLKEPIMK